jgi:phage host-nuclease inhibitor protein Gam
MKTRVTSRGARCQTRSEFEASIDRIAELTVRLRGLEARRDKKIQAVRDEFAADIDAALKERDALVVTAEAFAFDHRGELFSGSSKTASTAQALYGLRLGQPTLKLLSRKWTWAAVLEALKAVPGIPRFIRVSEEVDKDALKAQLGDKPEELAKLGCRIEQTEGFWVEPRDTAIAETQTVNTRG